MSRENTQYHIVLDGIMLTCFSLSREANTRQMKALRRIHRRAADALLRRREEYNHNTTPEEVMQEMETLLDRMEGRDDGQGVHGR